MPSEKDTAKNPLLTTLKEFKPDCLQFTPFKEPNERSNGQYVGFQRYTANTDPRNERLLWQLPWLHISKFGIPSLGDYYPTDKDRSFIKVPLDDKNDTYNKEETRFLIDKLKKLDEIYGSDDMKKQLFEGIAPKKWNKYTYNKIIREPDNDDDDDENVDPLWTKLKFDLSYPEGNVNTKVFLSQDVDGKKQRTPVEVETMTDVANHIRYLSGIRAIIAPVKLWAHAPSKKDPSYGISFKIVKIEVEPSSTSGDNVAYKQFIENDDFVDDEVEMVVETSESAGKKTEIISDDDSDSSEEDTDSSEEEEVVTKKKKGKTSKNKVATSSN